MNRNSCAQKKRIYDTAKPFVQHTTINKHINKCGVRIYKEVLEDVLAHFNEADKFVEENCKKYVQEDADVVSL